MYTALTTVDLTRKKQKFMHRALPARPPWFDSLPSLEPDCGRCRSSCSAGASKIKIRTSLADKYNFSNKARILIFHDPAEQEDWKRPQFRFFQVYSIVTTFIRS